jgi:hypothetical protein
MVQVLAAIIVVLAADAGDVVVDARDARVKSSAGFTLQRSPFTCNGHYLTSGARSNTAPAAVRIAAPEGEYFVYLTWVRHPQGARDVLVRAGSTEVRVDQSRLANGRSPEDFDRDDMPQFAGVCSSGLFRLTDRPIRFAKGDTIQVLRSDTAPNTVTTFETVVFSRALYLDDLGNDAVWTGKPVVNVRDYGRPASGSVGWGLAFLKPEQADAAIEWSLPVRGTWLLAADPNRGPSRAETIVLEVQLAGGAKKRLPLAGKSAQFGRAEWQPLGVLREAAGVKLRLVPAKGGMACADLLRLTPVVDGELTGADGGSHEMVTVQWEAPAPARPWLRSVRVVSSDGGRIETAALPRPAMLPHGLQVRLPRRRIAVLDAGTDTVLLGPADGSFRIELADDYGITLSAGLLQREPFVWLKDLGVFACRAGDFASHAVARDTVASQVAAARGQPFRSTSEKYYEWTGYDETRPRMDDRAFVFAYATPRPPAPRVTESLAVTPEVDHAYFLPRIEEPKHRRMFLGWPNVCQEFYVLSNGAIGVSSGSAHGTGHPPAQHFAVHFGVGDPPEFLAHGDPAVKQRIEDGYHVIVHSEWTAAGTTVRQTALAYPLAGEEVRTGYEPLAAMVRLRRTAAPSRDAPLWLKIMPDHWCGPQKPLAGLANARIEDGRLMAGDRNVLAVTQTRATVHRASDQEVLVRLDPTGDGCDLVIPYIAVDQELIARSAALGFSEVLRRTKRYWDDRLAAGARVTVPDPMVNNLYKTLYPRTLVCGDLDTQGDYALKTSPLVYDSVWLHCTAYGIEGLARRGHFVEARQYLEAAFHWQGSQAVEAKQYTTWKGFFNAPPRYTALLWINFHGWLQWAAARYYLFSDDRAWLDEKLPALLASLEWTASQRRLTMHDNADGSRPLNYGWLPPGRVTDGSAGTSTFSDCINWMGFHELTRVLERLGHPRAAEFRKEADNYRACILRGLRRATALREPVRLNDGTFVPYVPGYLESTGHEETMWYAAVVDGALEGILDSGICAADDPLEDWVLQNLEDNLFVIAPNLADEAYFLGHGCGYLRRDQPPHAIYTFYSVLASHMSRQTLTTFEHRSWGAGRVYDLAPWPLGYYTRMLAGMLCWDEGDELCYCRATPRAWLEPGKRIEVERLQTRFGPTSIRLEAFPDRVCGELEVPQRHRPAAVRFRIRVRGAVTAVKVNGREAAFDAVTGTVALPTDAGRVTIEAFVKRNSE